MPTESARKGRLQVLPALREGVVLARATVLPPEPTVRRTRVALVVLALTSLAGGAWVVTGSALWAFMVVIVGVPIVALPAFLIVGIVREGIAGRTRPDD